VPAQLRFIVSGVQVLAEGHGWECWGNLPRERDRLVELIARKRAQGVVFLSGDRHIGAYYKRPATTALGGSYPLYEMTSSGLTHAWAQAKEAGPNRLGDLITTNHYGLIDVDWKQQRLNLQFKGEKGEALRAHAIDFKELRA
jgi:alkaline phosphatase D